MATKKQMQQFNDTVEKYLISIGASKLNRRMGEGYTGFTYNVNTNVGTMDVSCHEAEASKVFSIYMVFDDHKRALSELGRNDIGQTGKWNVHEYTATEAITMMKYKIGRAIEKEPMQY